MIKKYWKTLLVTSTITILPFIFFLTIYNTLPEQIPIHMNIAGEIDGYGPKILLLLMPLILLLTEWISIIELQIRQKKGNQESKPYYIQLMTWTISTASCVLGVVMYNMATLHLLNMQKWTFIIVGVLFIVMGNLTPKIPQNKWVGLRTSATLTNKNAWLKANRLMGKTGVIAGVIILLTGFLPASSALYTFLFVVMLAAVLIPVVYAYILKYKDKATTNKDSQ